MKYLSRRFSSSKVGSSLLRRISIILMEVVFSSDAKHERQERNYFSEW